MNTRMEKPKGRINEACQAVGCSRPVFYDAKRRIQQGKALSVTQTAVIEAYNKLLKKEQSVRKEAVQLEKGI